MKRKRVSVTIFVFSLCAIGIAVLAIWPFSNTRPQERHRTRLIVPAAAGSSEADSALAELRHRNRRSRNLAFQQHQAAGTASYPAHCPGRSGKLRSGFRAGGTNGP